MPLSQTGAELLFEIFSQRHERSSTIVKSNLPFEEWTSLFRSMYYAGLDISVKRTAVCIVDAAGKPIHEKSVDSTSQAIAAAIKATGVEPA